MDDWERWIIEKEKTPFSDDNDIPSSPSIYVSWVVDGVGGAGLGVVAERSIEGQ